MLTFPFGFSNTRTDKSVKYNKKYFSYSNLIKNWNSDFSNLNFVCSRSKVCFLNVIIKPKLSLICLSILLTKQLSNNHESPFKIPPPHKKTFGVQNANSVLVQNKAII